MDKYQEKLSGREIVYSFIGIIAGLAAYFVVDLFIGRLFQLQALALGAVCGGFGILAERYSSTRMAILTPVLSIVAIILLRGGILPGLYFEEVALSPVLVGVQCFTAGLAALATSSGHFTSPFGQSDSGVDWVEADFTGQQACSG